MVLKISWNNKPKSQPFLKLSLQLRAAEGFPITHKALQVQSQHG